MTDYVVVKNIWPIQQGAQNQKVTNISKTIGDQGTVRVVLGGIEYVWGPNESKTLPSNLAAEAVAAEGTRLRIADSRDGFDGQARS
jgi:hypothetical protein